MTPSAVNLPYGQSLLGKHAVVTGASSGIGRAIAMELAQAGAGLVIHARKSRGRLEELAEKIKGMGVQVEVLIGDLASSETHQKLLETSLRRRTLDYWINNAGADVLTGPAGDWTFEKKIDQLWRVDVLATIQLSRMAGPVMTDGGVIINMGWDQASVGMAGDSGEMFAATKGAIMAFSKSLAKSLAPRIRVNCVAPGWIKTAWGDAASDYWQQRALTESLSGRWGTSEDVARVVRFLISDEGQFINGQVVNVNGGAR